MKRYRWYRYRGSQKRCRENSTNKSRGRDGSIERDWWSVKDTFNKIKICHRIKFMGSSWIGPISAASNLLTMLQAAEAAGGVRNLLTLQGAVKGDKVVVLCTNTPTCSDTCHSGWSFALFCENHQPQLIIFTVTFLMIINSLIPVSLHILSFVSIFAREVIWIQWGGTSESLDLTHILTEVGSGSFGNLKYIWD